LPRADGALDKQRMVAIIKIMESIGREASPVGRTSAAMATDEPFLSMKRISAFGRVANRICRPNQTQLVWGQRIGGQSIVNCWSDRYQIRSTAYSVQAASQKSGHCIALARDSASVVEHYPHRGEYDLLHMRPVRPLYS